MWISKMKHKIQNRICLIIAAVLLLAVTGCEPEKPAVQDNQQPAATEPISEPVKETPVTNPQVKMKTNMGDIVIELDSKNAPLTTANFLEYVNQDLYAGTIFHRVIPGFMIQGGGFTSDMKQKNTNPPIKLESDNGLKNTRGTVAMARTNDPDSATSQFFINVVDNAFLDYVPGKNPGYAVFGKVISGMVTVDKIAAVKTATAAGMGDVPTQPVIIEKVEIIESD
jgi:peptidyl-prolyl cis-trans isomerase A (cyclophilin A)